MRNTKRFMGLFMAAMMILTCLSGVIFVSADEATTEIKPVFIYEGWALDCGGGNNCNPAEYDYDKGYITLTATGDDAYYSLNAGVVAGPYMVVKYRTSVAEGVLSEMFIGASAGAIGATDNITWSIEGDGEWHSAIVYIGDLADYNMGTHEINHIRFDFFQQGYEHGSTMDVEYIAFFNDEATAKAYIDGNCHKLPAPPQTFTATFMVDGEVYRTITYKEGAPSINAPAVPKKADMVGKWEKYTLTGDIVINAVYTEYNPHLFDDFNHIDQFGEEHSEYIQFNQCVPTFNEDGTITYKGSWGIDADVDAKITIDYYRLMQNFNGTGAKFNKNNLANAKGDGNVVVFKVKGSPVMAEEGCVQLHLTAGLGSKNQQEYWVDPVNVINGDGSEEYLIFDLTGEDGYENLFIKELDLSWAFTFGEEANLGSTCTLISIDMYASLDEALGATGETLPETEAPTEPEATEPEATEPEDTTAADSEPTTEPAKKEGGCGSVVATGAAVAVLAAAAAAVALKKKD